MLKGEPLPADLLTGSTNPQDAVLRDGFEVERRVTQASPYDPWEERAESRRSAAAYWHARDARAAEEAADWFAAVFHLDRLIRLTRDDRSLLERRKAAASHVTPEVLAILGRSQPPPEPHEGKGSQ
jgi:hypothetical protein